MFTRMQNYLEFNKVKLDLVSNQGLPSMQKDSMQKKSGRRKKKDGVCDKRSVKGKIMCNS